MALEDAVYGLIVIIVPIVILVVGLGLSRFLPTKKRLIGLILLLIGGLGGVVFGAGFIYSITRGSTAAMLGLGSLFAVELATIAAGIIIRRKKPLATRAVTSAESTDQVSAHQNQ